MNILSISLVEKKKNYPIIVGNSILNKISDHVDLKKYTSIAIVTDENISRWTHYLSNILPVKPVIVILPSGEAAKNINTLQTIWKKLVTEQFDRKSLIINLGGGVIGDMGGFAASTYMRGIDFIQVPTTLLSMVDASVGGKLAVDFEGYKNIIGSFVQPKAVIIDTKFLTSLPDREFIAGFAEIIKHGLIADTNYLHQVTSKKPREYSPEEMIAIIYKSCEIKAKIVQQDEQETGLRKILNFGHTVGHAIESLSFKTAHPLLHGEAVAIGIVAETKLSHLIGNITFDQMMKIKSMIQHVGLPTSYPGLSEDDILDSMKMDKKNEKGIYKWTLLKSIGQAVYDIQIDDSLLKDVIDSVISK